MPIRGPDPTPIDRNLAKSCCAPRHRVAAESRCAHVHCGSWLCENAPAEALTAGHVGAAGELSHFREFDEFLV